MARARAAAPGLVAQAMGGLCQQNPELVLGAHAQRGEGGGALTVMELHGGIVHHLADAGAAQRRPQVAHPQERVAGEDPGHRRRHPERTSRGQGGGQGAIHVQHRQIDVEPPEAWREGQQGRQPNSVCPAREGGRGVGLEAAGGQGHDPILPINGVNFILRRIAPIGHS